MNVSMDHGALERFAPLLCELRGAFPDCDVWIAPNVDPGLYRVTVVDLVGDVRSEVNVTEAFMVAESERAAARIAEKL